MTLLISFCHFSPSVPAWSHSRHRSAPRISRQMPFCDAVVQRGINLWHIRWFLITCSFIMTCNIKHQWTPRFSRGHGLSLTYPGKVCKYEGQGLVKTCQTADCPGCHPSCRRPEPGEFAQSWPGSRMISFQTEMTEQCWFFHLQYQMQKPLASLKRIKIVNISYQELENDQVPVVVSPEMINTCSWINFIVRLTPRIISSILLSCWSDSVERWLC